jgi:hypothetical protein
MYAQCDEEVNQLNIMECIVDHKTDGHAVDHADMYIEQGSNTQVRKTTKGWHLCAEWKYGTTLWERLADTKEINAVEVYECAVSKNLHNSPDFVWWVLYVLKKCSHISADATKRYHKWSHKFGVEVPKIWDDCARLDKRMTTLFCRIQ